MNDLVYSLNGGLVTDQNKISTISKVDINSIQKLIRNYKQDLECFGELGFELQKIAKTNKKIYFLNEQQATLLLTYMKNSESVRNAKKVLVFAFYQMKEKLRSLEQEQEKARFKSLSDENQRLNSLNHHQKIGYKSQLKQQKEKYENKIKALKYDLENKKELSFKRKLSQKELLELRKILAKDYNIVCFKEWEMSLFAEKIGKNSVFEVVLNKLEKELNYWKNYEKYEEKWKKNIKELKMKLVDKLKKAYDYKKELYKAEKGSSSKEYHIENAEIFQDFIELELLQCEDIERRYFLMQIYRYGYQNIRSLNSKLAFKAKLDNDDINFIKILKEANILHALNEIYTTKEVKKIAKD